MSKPTTIGPPLTSVRKHGNRSGYVRGCRCEPCVLANREWKRNWRGQRPMDVYLAELRDNMQAHGYGAYDRGCRCAVCRAANAAVHRRSLSDSGRVARDRDTACESCEGLFAGEHGLRRHLALGCPGVRAAVVAHLSVPLTSAQQSPTGDDRAKGIS